MTTFDQYYTYKIRFIEFENKLMCNISTVRGFLELFNERLLEIDNAELAFVEVNTLYKSLVGVYRFADYIDFLKQTQLKSVVNNQVREHLIAWFSNKGFSTWETFSSLVLHFYPEITTVGLKAFYLNNAYAPEVLKKVEYVKQIIG